MFWELVAYSKICAFNRRERFIWNLDWPKWDLCSDASIYIWTHDGFFANFIVSIFLMFWFTEWRCHVVPFCPYTLNTSDDYVNRLFFLQVICNFTFTPKKIISENVILREGLLAMVEISRIVIFFLFSFLTVVLNFVLTVGVHQCKFQFFICCVFTS